MPEATSYRSFSDPDGFVEVRGDCVYRYAKASAVAQFSWFLEEPAGARLLQQGAILGYRVEGPAAEGEMRLSHPKIWFPTFPYEWIPHQLHAAASLTLDIEAAANGAGYELKDASPYNVVHDGSRAVFVDLPSLRPIESDRWHAYGQFVREFIILLLGSRYL